MSIVDQSYHFFCTYLQKELKAKLLKRMIVLYVSDTYWIAAKGYRLYRFDVSTQKWNNFSRLSDHRYSLLSSFYLTKRLFRAEITHLYNFDNELLICIAKKGIFKYNKANRLFEKCFSIEKGSRPMALCQDKKGIIYFGDYYSNAEKDVMNIYKSNDEGNHWQIAYTFPKGKINHIHGIFNDPYSDKLWIMTGDLDDECMIGYSEDGFESVISLYGGSQRYRMCAPLFFKDKIVFGTDSQYEQNVIRKMDRKTGEIKDLCTIQGSGIYGVQIGQKAFISTTVEPSRINQDRQSYLWYSTDGEEWKEVLHFEKDCWKMPLFQFGSIRFPYFDPSATFAQMIITGRALKHLDGNSLIFSLPF